MEEIRIPELEGVILENLQKKIDNGEKVYFNEYFLKETLKSLVNYTYHTPFTFDFKGYGPYRSGQHDIILKARNAGTKIIKINYKCHFENSQGWYGGDFVLDDIKITSMTKKVTDFKSFLEYLEERAKKVDAKAEEKIDNFIKECQSKGIELKDFFELERQFYSNDGFTRNYLQRMGK